MSLRLARPAIRKRREEHSVDPGTFNIQKSLQTRVQAGLCALNAAADRGPVLTPLRQPGPSLASSGTSEARKSRERVSSLRVSRESAADGALARIQVEGSLA